MPCQGIDSGTVFEDFRAKSKSRRGAVHDDPYTHLDYLSILPGRHCLPDCYVQPTRKNMEQACHRGPLFQRRRHLQEHWRVQRHLRPCNPDSAYGTDLEIATAAEEKDVDNRHICHRICVSIFLRDL